MEKTYKLKKCPKCGLYDKLGIVIGEKDLWNCGCGWSGRNPENQEVSEEEYLKFADSLDELSESEDLD